MASRSVVLAAVCISFDVLLTFNFTHSRPFCPLATLFDFYATAASVLAHAPLSLSPPNHCHSYDFFFFGSFYVLVTASFHYCDIQSILSFSPDFKQIFLALPALRFRFCYPFLPLSIFISLSFSLPLSNWQLLLFIYSS